MVVFYVLVLLFLFVISCGAILTLDMDDPDESSFQDREKRDKRYSVKEIREYLKGWKFVSTSFSSDSADRNTALNNAIISLEDPQDGIGASVELKGSIK